MHYAFSQRWEKNLVCYVSRWKSNNNNRKICVCTVRYYEWSFLVNHNINHIYTTLNVIVVVVGAMKKIFCGAFCLSLDAIWFHSVVVTLFHHVCEPKIKHGANLQASAINFLLRISFEYHTAKKHILVWHLLFAFFLKNNFICFDCQSVRLM